MGIESADSGNIGVRNYGRNPAINFNFMLRVEGLWDLPCRAVRAFQKENEYEMIQEGGLNDYVHMRRKPVSKPFTFQVERYVGVDVLDPLALGTDLILPVILIVNRYLAYGDFFPTRTYTFTGCTVMAKEYGELNAEKSGLMLETTTIGYREMIYIDNPIAVYSKIDGWDFNGTTKEGDGNQYARHNPAGEATKAELEKKAKRWNPKKDSELNANNNTTSAMADGTVAEPPKPADSTSAWTYNKYKGITAPTKPDALKNAKKWQMNEKDYLGTKGSAVKVNDFFKNSDPNVKKELGKKAMEKKAVQWEFDLTSKEGNGEQSAILNSGELNKKAMEKKAVIWKPGKADTKSAVSVASFLAKK